MSKFVWNCFKVVWGGGWVLLGMWIVHYSLIADIFSDSMYFKLIVLIFTILISVCGFKFIEHQVNKKRLK